MALTKKLTGAIVAIAFVLTALITFAFKANDKSEASKRFTTTWYYNSDSDASGDITDGSKWIKVNPNHTGCVSANEALPCQLEVDNAVTNSSQLDAYFTTQYSDSPTAIKAAATSRRPMPD
ncbi:hypothetical protein [Pedobacter sp. MC2016-24]|uniref:hypothetical protein n=1 Tax=Pedobacter sp. MC2016-24 TaxID=2780090 RepID=UPI00187E9A78|nr:hypothetical protein [Pedobacter sp. MC2016-24]MBE9597852.1 hypothetical protein [Pedobacter sp. MC2016-24]